MKTTKSTVAFGYYVSKRKDELKKEWERKRQEILKELDSVLLDLSEMIHFEDAIIFGSITKQQRFREDSDIDLAFVGLDNEDYFKSMSFISERLKRNVEIIQLEKHCRFKEKIIGSGIKWRNPLT